MSDIFLSYKSEDQAKAQIIAEALERNGYSVWWDRVIPPGRTFDEVIEEELDAAKCVVALWSKESVKSEWVRTEASEGKIRKFLIPVLIEDVTPPLAFRLIEAAKLINWDGTVPNPEFDLLLGSVSRMLGTVPAPETEIQKTGDQGKEERKKMEIKKWEEERAEKEEQKRKELEIRDKKETERLQEKKTFINSISMKFTLIPEGEFMMGSKKRGFLAKISAKAEQPIHKVIIRKPFYLGIYLVTQREWEKVIEENPSQFSTDLPVNHVSWDDVQNFITKLNEKEGSDKYRLPSEAEWEYAARAGTTTRYFFGDNKSELGEYAWYFNNSYVKRHLVGQKKPNPWRLYDMYGNVCEYVQDEWHSNYDGAPTDGSAWEDGNGASRVLRGGGWGQLAYECQSTHRIRYIPCIPTSLINGFRLLKEL